MAFEVLLESKKFLNIIKIIFLLLLITVFMSFNLFINSVNK